MGFYLGNTCFKHDVAVLNIDSNSLFSAILCVQFISAPYGQYPSAAYYQYTAPTAAVQQ